VGAFDTIQQKKSELIRKALEGSVFVAPIGTTAVTASSLFATPSGTLQALPSGYKDLGYLDDSGAKFARAITTDDVTSWGSVEPTRSDITKDTTTLNVVAQEANLSVIGLYTGVDPASISTTLPNGVVSIQKPSVGATQYYRVVSIAVDEGDSGEIVIVRFLPRARVTNYGDQSFDKSAAGIVWPVTFTSYEDSTLGFSEETIFGGEGWKAIVTDAGFTLGT
jgi:hypothetical protein